MRRHTQAALLALLLLGATSSGGCAALLGAQGQNPKAVLANATDLYAVAVETMTNLSRTNSVDLKTMESFEAVRVRAAAALDAAEAAINAGQDFSVADLQNVLSTLQSIVTIAAQVAQ